MKTTITKVTAVFLAVFLSTVVAFSQTIVTTVPSITKCPTQTGQTNFDVTVQNFTNIGSLSLKMKFNPAVMLYTGYTVNANIAQGFIINGQNTGPNAGTVKMAWFTLDSASIPSNGIIITLKFNYLGGNSGLSWDTLAYGDCQYSNTLAEPLPAVFIDGGVSVTAAPSFLVNPANLAVNTGDNALFTVQTAGAATYQWQESTDGGVTWTNLVDNTTYSGVTNDSLIITATTAGMSGYLYQSIATETQCSLTTTSTYASLTLNTACPTPTPFNMTGGGDYCLNGYPKAIGLSNTENNVLYSLYKDGVFTGITMYGIGAFKVFGYNFTEAGVYTATGSNSCGDTAMVGTATITIIPGPTPFVTTGGGAFCPGGAGVPVGLSGSELGVSYTLFRGNVKITTLAGTGSALNYGLYNVVGNYRVKSTSCGEFFNNGSVDVSLLQSPSDTISMTGGGSICAGDFVNIGLLWSEDSVVYTLLKDGLPTTAVVTGDGNAINFGSFLVAGVYSVQASTDCDTVLLDNTVIVAVTPIPTQFTVGGGGPICPGSTAVDISLSGSETGVNYDLYLNGTASGYTLAGTGSPLSFTGIEVMGTYTVHASAALAPCYSTQSGSASVSGQPALYVAQNPENAIVLEGDDVLFQVIANIPHDQLSFQWQVSTDAGNTYTAISNGSVYTGVNTSSLTVNNAPYAFNGFLYTCVIQDPSCSQTVTTAAVSLTVDQPLSINTYLPALSGLVPGSTISIPVTADNLQDVGAISLSFLYDIAAMTYVGYSDVHPLLNAGSFLFNDLGGKLKFSWFDVYPVTLSTGTLFNLEFTYNGGPTGLTWNTAEPGQCQYADGDGNILNANFFNGSISGCTLPVVYDLSGGGNYCPGASGLSIDLSNSEVGVNYILYHDGISTMYLIEGTGAPISFTGFTASGNYTVNATNGACSAWQNGNVSITVSDILYITSNPIDVSIEAGENASYSVATNFDESLLTFQWQVSTDGGIVYVNVVDGGYYSGANTSTLTITAAPFSFNGNIYQSVITESGCNQSVTSMFADINIIQALAINTYLPAITGIIQGNTFSVPVTAEYLQNVSAISLAFLYDNTSMTYQGYSNLNPLLSAGSFLFNDVSGKLKFSWFDVTPVNMASGTLFNLDFVYNGGSTLLTWDLGLAGQCQYADADGNILDANFFNGSVTGCPVPVSFSANPSDVTITEGSDAIFSATANYNDNDAAYQWQISGDGGLTFQNLTNGVSFSGVNSATLTVIAAPYSYNGYEFRCVVTEPECNQSAVSAIAILTVNQIVNINTYLPTIIGAVPGTTVSIPVTAENISNVGAISLTYLYDNSVLTYVGYSGLNTDLGAGLYTFNETNGKVKFGWFNTVPFNLASGILFYIDFTFNGGTSALTWNVAQAGDCQYADFNGDILSASFFDGSITGCSLPTAYTVSGGGAYCTGGAGASVAIDYTETATNYEVFVNGFTSGFSFPGIGGAQSFVFQAAGTYTIVATNSCGSKLMDGSAVISTLPLPAAFAVSGGGDACGVNSAIILSGSETSTLYNLYLNGVFMGTFVGDGNAIDMGTYTGAGTYIVVAANSCGNTDMSGSAVVTANPPAIFAVTGGGSFCQGAAGVSVGLDGSETGTTYTLLLNNTTSAGTLSGTGSALDFGLQMLAGNYTISASTACGTSTMTGNAVVSYFANPTVFTVSGGGAYCVSNPAPSVGLNGSETGVTYTLYFNGINTGNTLSGTGNAISFGSQTAAGTYTIEGTNQCATVFMAGSANVSINPGPFAYTVTGGGSYCTGGSGVAIGLDGSEASTVYTLLYNGTSTGISVAGTGNAISFGLQSATGTYTVSGTNNCGTSAMSNSVAVSINTLPAVFGMTGGGDFLGGGAGISVGLDGSENGVSYSLYVDGLFTGQIVAGTGSAISFGNQAIAGNYTASAVNTTTGCTITMTGSALVTVTPVIVSSPSDTAIYAGYNGTFTVIAAGATGYQWQVSFDGGLTWTNLTNTAPYYNVNTNTLTVIGAPITMNGYMFQAIVSSGTASVTSTPATLSVTPAPVLTIIAPTMTAAVGTSILVPINVLNFGGISAFNLTLNYDASALTYAGITNMNPGLSTSDPNLFMFTNGNVPGQFFMAYMSMTPASIGDGKLFDLEFFFNGPWSPLTWQLVPHEGAEFSDPFGNILPCIWINGSINSPTGIVITDQPDDTTACEGGSTGFSITAPGASTYQWMASSNYGLTWFNLINSQLYSGVNTSSLVVNGVSPSMESFLFACVVDAGLPTSAISNSASFVITPFVTVPGTIVASPGTTICPGDNVTFAVNAAYDLTGATYQWFVNYIPVATTATYSSTGLNNGDVIKVDVYVDGSCAFLSIPNLTMVVDPNPVVTTSPVDVITVVGDNPGFSVIATAPGNSPLSYQWQISTDGGATWTNLTNSPDYSGVTTASMSITYSTMAMDGHLFRVVVTEGTCGNTVTSEVAQLYMFYGPIITKLEDQVVCGNATMVVPVLVDNFIDVASISLKLNYDASVLTYTGYQNVNPALTANPFSLFTVSATSTQVGIFGYSLTPVSMANNSTMVELLFVPVPGTSSLDWDDQTFGSCMYTDIYGTVIPDEYINANTITINPLPTIFQVTGGGEYCTGGDGQPVGLSGSEVGFTYELFNNNFTTFLTLAGTGGPLDFGYQFADGVYTIISTNNVTGCSQIMGGSALIVIHPVPPVTFTGILETQCLGVTSYVLTGGAPGGGTYSGPGVVNNLFYPTIAGVGTHTITYSYQDPINGCVNFATNTITVIHGPLPNNVTGGGSYCAGGIGVAVGLSGSEIGMLYQTQINGILNGPYVGGTGFPITFGLQTIPGVYTIFGTDPNTGCTLVMPNSVTVVVDPLPTAYNVTGGGNYCTNGTGVTVGLSNSASGINYELYLYGIATGQVVAGTGSAISFGLQTAPGVYTVYATNTVTTCENWMNGSVTVNLVALPVTFTVVGGGSQCVGGNGLTVGLSGSQIAVNYQLYLNGVATSSILGGTGMALNFGLQTQSGTYTVVATDMINGCVLQMAGTATVTINALPVVTWTGNLSALCIDASPITLSGGLPAGGTYSGPGVYGTTFNPALAGAGTHTLTYSFTDFTTGCTNTAINMIVVNALPNVTFAGKLETQCSSSTALLLLTGSPAGGTYSGAGVTGNIFNASVAGLGTHVITYTYTNPLTGCTSFATNEVTVVPGPTVAWTAQLLDQCANATTYVLPSGTPAGGVFSGPGVTGNVFNASAVGAGTYTLTYSFTYTANGCSGSTSNTIVVNPLPTLSWSDVLTNQCITSTSYTLTGASPAGGTYSGNGVVGNNFDASVAGLGLHTLAYTYTDGNGCTNTIFNTITVFGLPTVSFGPLSAVCVSQAAFALTTGTPAGGTYSGPGVSAGSFNPSVAGVGTHTLTYTYSNASGCINSATTTITVYSLPSAAFGPVAPVCVNAAAFTLTTGTPAGGVYSGPGVSGGMFNPAIAGVGTHTLTYTVTNANNCTSSASTTVTVNSLPTVTWSNALTAQCVSSSTYALTGGLPAGGTYSGPGVNGTNFNAALVGALLGTGTYTLTYTYTNSNGCTSSATNTIVVNPLPIVTWTGTLADQCSSATTYALTGGIPSGGTYSGPGVTGSNFNASLAGTGTHTLVYTYTNPTTGCSNFTTKMITVLEPIGVYWTNALPSPCQNVTAVVLTGATPAGGTYSGPGVSGGVFNPSLVGPGSYTLTYTYTNADGCTGTATNNITVNALPVVTWTNALTTQCADNSFYLLSGGSPAGGTYSGPGVFGNNFNAANVGAGTYTLTYTFTSAAGCTNFATNTITVSELPTVTLGPDQNICFGTSTTINATASAGVTYIWSTSASTPSITVVVGDTTTYSVTVTNAFGCQAVDEMVVNMLPLPDAQAHAFPKTICQGESSSISATGGSGPNPYLWSTGQTSASFVSNNNQDTTVFFVTVTNIYGCQSVTNIKLNVNVIPVVQLNGGIAQLNACNYTIATLLPGPGPYDTYLWNTGEQSPNLVVETDLLGASTFNTFSVTVTLNGCQAKDDIILFVDPCGGIPEVGTQQLIEIYPNPTDGMFTINLENIGEGTILDIYNNLGQKLHHEKLSNNNQSRFTKNFDLSAYPVGIYFLRFADNDKVYSRKLIVR